MPHTGIVQNAFIVSEADSEKCEIFGYTVIIVSKVMVSIVKTINSVLYLFHDTKWELFWPVQ